MGSYIEALGRADFKCRSKEEATWFALYLNKYYQSLDFFPHEQEICNLNLDKEKPNIEGIFVTINENKKDVYLSLHVNRIIKRNMLFEAFFPTIYFLSTQTEMINCDIDIKGEGVGSLTFIKNKNGRIHYRDYENITHQFVFNDRKINFFDIVKAYIYYFKPIQKIYNGSPVIVNHDKEEKVVVKLDEDEKSYKVYDILNKLLILIFERADIFPNIYNLIKDIPNYDDWEKSMKNIKITQKDIDELLFKKNIFDTFDKNSKDDLNKIQAIFYHLMDSLSVTSKDNFGHSIWLCTIKYNDHFLNKKNRTCSFLINIQPNYFTLRFEYAKKLTDTYFDSFYKSFILVLPDNYLKAGIKHGSVYNLFIKLTKFSGDYYKYLKTLPKVYLNEKYYIPLDNYFIQLFMEEFKSKKIINIENKNDTFRLTEKNEKNENSQSICELCINQIRKSTIGCESCFDFQYIPKK